MALIASVDVTLLLIATGLAVFPLIVHYLSTFIFYRTIYSDVTNKTPPTVPYWVPGVFHGARILTQGPSTFFANVFKQYDTYAPFFIKAGSFSVLIIRDADHIGRVLQSANQMTTRSIHVKTLDKVMGSPKEALRLLGPLSARTQQSDKVEYAHLTIPRKYLSGEPLVPMAETYISALRRNLADKMFQDNTWTEIEDLWSFFQHEVTRALIETVFGSAIFKSYPRVVRDFWEFENNVENFMLGCPRFMMPKAYLARDRLHENLKKWLQTVHEGNSFAKVADGDPEWDADRGSKFFQATDSVFANIPSLDYQARVAEALAMMHESNSSTVPSTFWCIFETLRNPILMKSLSTEMRPQYNPSTGKYNVAALTSVPIMQSMHAEIGRLRVATTAIRTNGTEGFKLDDSWSIPKGSTVLIFSHDLALNTALWAQARPQTVEKPLGEFWAERFLVHDQTAKRKTDHSKTARFSMENVESLHTAFGGGQHLCPGRYLARAVHAGTLAVLLSEYDIQLSDPESADEVIPPVREIAYGTIRPSGPVRMRIRKRTTGKQTKAS